MTVAAAALAACGGNHHQASDAAPCAPRIVYLDRAGGDYDRGPVDDATANRSVILDGPRTLPPWPMDDAAWAITTSCIRDALAPFALDVTEIDPGATPHVELVFTTTSWLDAAMTSAIPSSCQMGHQIELVFGSAIATPTGACEIAMGAFAEMTALLSPAQDCLDFTSPANDCGVRFFVNQMMPCVDALTGQPAACRCGGTMENTFAALDAEFPACAARHGGD